VCLFRVLICAKSGNNLWYMLIRAVLSKVRLPEGIPQHVRMIFLLIHCVAETPFSQRRAPVGAHSKIEGVYMFWLCKNFPSLVFSLRREQKDEKGKETLNWPKLPEQLHKTKSGTWLSYVEAHWWGSTSTETSADSNINSKDWIQPTRIQNGDIIGSKPRKNG
jgi:hypothetical protein